MAVDVKVEVEKRDSPATLINECLVKAALKHARLMPQMPAIIVADTPATPAQRQHRAQQQHQQQQQHRQTKSKQKSTTIAHNDGEISDYKSAIIILSVFIRLHIFMMNN